MWVHFEETKEKTRKRKKFRRKLKLVNKTSQILPCLPSSPAIQVLTRLEHSSSGTALQVLLLTPAHFRGGVKWEEDSCKTDSNSFSFISTLCITELYEHYSISCQVSEKRLKSLPLLLTLAHLLQLLWSAGITLSEDRVTEQCHLLIAINYMTEQRRALNHSWREGLCKCVHAREIVKGSCFGTTRQIFVSGPLASGVERAKQFLFLERMFAVRIITVVI